MTETRDWQHMKEMSARLLEERTGEGVETWNRRIAREFVGDEAGLRRWLAERGVTGYARSLLVMERFGYPDFLLASADELIDGQYADRPELRPIPDAILQAAAGVGEVVVQARKTYVSLVSPRRTFARVQATTRERVDLGLRLEGQELAPPPRCLSLAARAFGGPSEEGGSEIRSGAPVEPNGAGPGR